METLCFFCCDLIQNTVIPPPAPPPTNGIFLFKVESQSTVSKHHVVNWTTKSWKSGDAKRTGWTETSGLTFLGIFLFQKKDQHAAHPSIALKYVTKSEIQDQPCKEVSRNREDSWETKERIQIIHIFFLCTNCHLPAHYLKLCKHDVQRGWPVFFIKKKKSFWDSSVDAYSVYKISLEYSAAWLYIAGAFPLEKSQKSNSDPKGSGPFADTVLPQKHLVFSGIT